MLPQTPQYHVLFAIHEALLAVQTAENATSVGYMGSVEHALKLCSVAAFRQLFWQRDRHSPAGTLEDLLDALAVFGARAFIAGRDEKNVDIREN